MKIATKTLTSLLIITLLTLSSANMVNATRGGGSTDQQKESRFERLTRRHDRKMELRASILGISPDQLKEELKNASFDQILKKHGFKTREAFQTAIAGKLKDELKKRGWSDEKIQKVIDKRLHRLEDKS